MPAAHGMVRRPLPHAVRNRVTDEPTHNVDRTARSRSRERFGAQWPKLCNKRFTIVFFIVTFLLRVWSP